MADLGLNGRIKDYNQESRSPYLIHKINPSAGWTNDSECYYLIMELPDFKQDQVEVRVDPLGNLIITGARLSGENEHVKFERHFKLPEDSDMTKTISTKLQNDMLYITVCRQLGKADNKFEPESASKEQTGGEHEQKNAEGAREMESKTKEGNADEGKNEYNVPNTILMKLDQYKCIWFGILAFACGVYVASHKLQQPPPR